MPSYNTGPRLAAVVAEALRQGWPVRVIVDGSTDASDVPLEALARTEPRLSVLRLPANEGKGGAVLAGARSALADGFSHGLIMDADGQHPAASIAEFMDAAREQPEAQILGRPRFPSNIPIERLYGRQLSIGLVRLLVLGPGIADPLFGFRVYPLAALLATLGPRRGGRRYDFDTESAVRLAWSGVPPVNRWAPVKYFSRAEGGVSHFHYLRDNVRLVWMHARLITELLLLRWPSLLRHRRAWRRAGWVAAVLMLGVIPSGPGRLCAAEPAQPVVAEERIPIAPGSWDDLARMVAAQSEVTADFTEHRYFPFRKIPVVLTGVSRVSAARGLSLQYLTPTERLVILDSEGMLLRDATGDSTPPADPRGDAANRALRHVLRLDFPALAQDFELLGRRAGDRWSLVLVPRADDLRRTLGRISVDGEAGLVRRIELRRSALQSVEILISPPRPPAPFAADDLKRYFR
ncbi:MAG: glycosyltransferase [Opitutaceae bacterium]|nr:glycosyltransferase [Opitutaceae bacterium]